MEARARRLPTVPVPGRFSLRHLEIPHDFMKMEIEGGETALLNYHGDLGECVIELHEWDSPGIASSLCQKHGLCITGYPLSDENLSILASTAQGRATS